MMLHVIKKPAIFTKRNGFAWYELHDKKGLYGYMAVKKHDDIAEVHLEFDRWGHNVIRQLQKTDVPQLLNICRKNNITKIVSVGESKITNMFRKHFGFGEPVTIAYREV